MECCSAELYGKLLKVPTVYWSLELLLDTESFYPKGTRLLSRTIGGLSGSSFPGHLSPDRHRWKECDIWTKEPLTSEKSVAHVLSIVFLSKMVPHIPPKGLQMVRPCRSVRRSYHTKCTSTRTTVLLLSQMRHWK